MGPSIEEIQVAVAQRYSTTVEEMLASRKLMPRQLAMYIARFISIPFAHCVRKGMNV